MNCACRSLLHSHTVTELLPLCSRDYLCRVCWQCYSLLHRERCLQTILHHGNKKVCFSCFQAGCKLTGEGCNFALCYFASYPCSFPAPRADSHPCLQICLNAVTSRLHCWCRGTMYSSPYLNPSENSHCVFMFYKQRSIIDIVIVTWRLVHLLF